MQPKQPGETHPINLSVRRGSDGVWGSDVLPVMPWENPGLRVVLSPDMQHVTGAPPVLRVPDRKMQENIASRPYAAIFLNNLSEYLLAAEGYAPDPREGRGGDWIVLVRDGDWWGRVVLSPLDSGQGWNVVTVYTTRRMQDIRRWKRHIGDKEGME